MRTQKPHGHIAVLEYYDIDSFGVNGKRRASEYPEARRLRGKMTRKLVARGCMEKGR